MGLVWILGMVLCEVVEKSPLNRFLGLERTKVVAA